MIIIDSALKAGDEKKAAKDSQQYAELNMTKAQRDVVMLTEIVPRNQSTH